MSTNRKKEAAPTKTDNAFVLIHFGANPKYFELELYFCMMLQKHTTNNIIYMFSERDTPPEFVREIRPYVFDTVGFNDEGITYKVDFRSGYTSFNTLRTCDFIFAYTLTQYNKVCIVESDLVIMKNMDDIFELNTPSVLCYECNKQEGKFMPTINMPNIQTREITDQELLKRCVGSSGLNGGVMLITPDDKMFRKYVSSIKTVAEYTCKYPNEALFELVNRSFYNLPVKYNVSHYHTLRLREMGIKESDVVVFHFNETDYKHLDIVKEKWLEKTENDTNPKYRVKKIAVFHFRDHIYTPYHKDVEGILVKLSEPKPSVAPPAHSATEDVWVEHFSKTQQRPYWVNTNTKETSWTKVVKKAIATEVKEVKKEIASQLKEVKKEIASQLKEAKKEIASQLKEVKKEITAENNDINPPSISKDEWTEHFSKTHKTTYWVNTKTGESVWTKPTSNGGRVKKTRGRKRSTQRGKKQSRKIRDSTYVDLVSLLGGYPST